MKFARTCTKCLTEVADRLARLAARAAKAVLESWRRHWERMAEEPGYAQAFVTVVIAVIELTTGGARIRAVLRELVAAYAAVLRALRSRRPIGPGWDWAGDI
jgi:hypothetical protein